MQLFLCQVWQFVNQTTEVWLLCVFLPIETDNYFKKTIPADLESQLASLREGLSLLNDNKQQVKWEASNLISTDFTL